MEAKRKQLIAWLKNAYGMEKSQIKMLDNFISDFEDDQDIKDKLVEHKSETEDQIDKLESCLDKFDESPSKIKEISGSMMGSFQGMSTSASDDKKIKDLLMIYAGENLEYGSYLSIKEAADELGEEEVSQIAGEIAEQEKSAAEWAEQQIPIVTSRQLAMA